jgi:L-amino acid N-acyltransferase YncA
MFPPIAPSSCSRLAAESVIHPQHESFSPSSGATGEAGASVFLRELLPHDWPEVSRIYAAGIATGNATFETEVPGWEEWDAAHLTEHRLVAVEGGRVVGWVALTGYSERCCYEGVADLSVYVDPASRGRGVGRALLEVLIADSERDGIWTLQAGVFPENAASLALHRRCGFRLVGVRERIGRLGGTWRDVLLLERRSAH